MLRTKTRGRRLKRRTRDKKKGKMVEKIDGMCQEKMEKRKTKKKINKMVRERTRWRLPYINMKKSV